MSVVENTVSLFFNYVYKIPIVHQIIAAHKAYIADRPIMDLFFAAEWRPGMRISRIWLDHPALDILGMRVVHAAEYIGKRKWRRSWREIYLDTEGRKHGGRLDKTEKIRRRLGIEVTNVARNPLKTVTNAPLASSPGKEFHSPILGTLRTHEGQVNIEMSYKSIYNTLNYGIYHNQHSIFKSKSQYFTV